MSQDHEKYRLPLKKFPRLLDLKIRGRLMKIKVQRWFVSLNDALSVKKLVASGLTLSVVAACGTLGARFHAYNGAVVPGDYLYDLRRDIEISYLEESLSSSERVEQLFDLSQRRLKEAELLLETSGVAFELIPQAFAQEDEGDVDSEVSELIIESSNYEGMALEEMSLIEDLEVLEDLSGKAEQFQQERDNMLEALNVKITREDDRKTFERVSDAVSQHRELFRELKTDLKDAREKDLKGIPFDARPIELPFKNKKKHRKHFERVRSHMEVKRIQRFAEDQIDGQEVDVLKKHVEQLIEDGRGHEVKDYLRTFEKKWKHDERVEKFREKKRGHFKEKLEKFEEVIPQAKREELNQRIERGEQDEVRREVQELRAEKERRENPPPETVFDLVKRYVEKVDDGELNLDGLPRIRELIKIAPPEEKRRIRAYLQENLDIAPDVLVPPERSPSR